MEKQIVTTIILGIFLISLASAVVIPAGTSEMFQINTTDTLYYDIVGNNNSIDGLNITQDIYEDYSNITISTNLMYQADEFTIIFFNIEKEVVHHYSSGGGSSKVIYKDKIIDHYMNKYIYPQDNESEVEEEVEEEVVDEDVDKALIIIIWLVALFFTIIIVILFKKRIRSFNSLPPSYIKKDINQSKTDVKPNTEQAKSVA